MKLLSNSTKCYYHTNIKELPFFNTQTKNFKNSLKKESNNCHMSVFYWTTP